MLLWPTLQKKRPKEPCLNFLRKLADNIGLVFKVYTPVHDKPNAILTWIGDEPTLPSILLNSHMDVVPVFEENWKYKPFEAEVDNEGNVYGRGVQDTKGLGIQYLEAIRRLKQNGFRPKRTVHVSFVSDEEIGGLKGMKEFVKTEYFKRLNIGYALDEGILSYDDSLFVYYGEKRSWKFFVHCPGTSGHGSALLDNTAGEKVKYILNKFYEFRAEQRKKQTDLLDTGDLISINLTMMMGGIQLNVVPSKFVITLDTRVPNDLFDEFEKSVLRWCKEAGEGIIIEDKVKDIKAAYTKIDNTNPLWVAFKAAFEKMNIVLKPRVLLATSDARFLRAEGIPTLGFNPSQNTVLRAHDDNEYLNIGVFLKGIAIIENVIKAIVNI